MSRDTGLCPRKTPQWPLLLPQPGLPRTDKLTLHVWAVNSPGSRLPQSRRSASGHPSSPPRTHWVSLPATSSAPKGTCRLSRVGVFQAEQRTRSPRLCPPPALPFVPSQALGPSGKPDPTDSRTTHPSCCVQTPERRPVSHLPLQHPPCRPWAGGGCTRHREDSLGRGVAGRAAGAVGSEPDHGRCGAEVPPRATPLTSEHGHRLRGPVTPCEGSSLLLVL